MGIADIRLETLNSANIGEAARLVAAYNHPEGYNCDDYTHCEATVRDLQAIPDSKFILAVMANSFAGFIFLYWGFSISMGKPILYIQDLFVMPERRHLGVGKALLSFARDLAIERGAGRLQLLTDTDNEAARRLYSSFGFQWFPKREVYMLFL
jgi:ribosomal protein S18 acetylase RimI-like enzyme